jgi:hypothetical protein
LMPATAVRAVPAMKFSAGNDAPVRCKYED